MHWHCFAMLLFFGICWFHFTFFFIHSFIWPQNFSNAFLLLYLLIIHSFWIHTFFDDDDDRIDTFTWNTKWKRILSVSSKKITFHLFFYFLLFSLRQLFGPSNSHVVLTFKHKKKESRTSNLLVAAVSKLYLQQTHI